MKRDQSQPRVALFLPSLVGGGAERVMLNLAIGFAERGFRTDLVLARAEGPYLPLVPPSVRLIDLNAPRVLRAVVPLVAYLRRERPAALLSALNHANIVAMLAAHTPGARTRAVISIHNTLGKERLSSARERALPWLLGALHHCADVIVAVSRGVADDFALTTGVPRDRIAVIYNPVITPALLQASSDRPFHPWFEDPTRPVVLGVGRLTRQKNFPALVDAFAIVRSRHRVRLVILGEGPEKTAIEARIRMHGLEESAALPGFTENPYACMARAAVLALSSDWEGLPTVLIESLALGTPVVSTDCPSGPREILRDGELGDLVPLGDIAALALAIERAIMVRRCPLPEDVLRPYIPDTALDQYHQVFEIDA